MPAPFKQVLAAAELDPELLTGPKLSNTIGALLGTEEYDPSAAQVAFLLIYIALMMLLGLTRDALVVAVAELLDRVWDFTQESYHW